MFCLMLTGIVNTVIAQPMKREKIGDNILLKLPKAFKPMSEEAVMDKYESYRRPSAVYTHTVQQGVDFTVNISASQWMDGDHDLMKEFYKSSLYSFMDSVVFLKDEIVTINEQDFAVLAFVSSIKAQENAIRRQPAVRQFGYYFYTLFDKKTYVFGLNAPPKDNEQWIQTAEDILKSIKMKKTKQKADDRGL